MQLKAAVRGTQIGPLDVQRLVFLGQNISGTPPAPEQEVKAPVSLGPPTDVNSGTNRREGRDTSMWRNRLIMTALAFLLAILAGGLVGLVNLLLAEPPGPHSWGMNGNFQSTILFVLVSAMGSLILPPNWLRLGMANGFDCTKTQIFGCRRTRSR